MAEPRRVLELFCGIGGCAAALGARATVVAAVDIHPGLLHIYRHNFDFSTAVRTIESMPDLEFHTGEAGLWWLSPPCQPFTRRGRQRDLADPRTAALLSLIAQRYRGALDIVAAEDPRACAACFTAAYGRAHVRSGSYLITLHGLRRFSPREVLRLLGFPDGFRFPPETARGQAWRHLGNSLSVVAVRHVLSMLPGLGPMGP